MEYIVHSGWMSKKGKLVKSWKKRFFELHKDGSLYYYTDEYLKNDTTIKGKANLSVIIGINIVDNLNYEIITPQRNWSFKCDSKSQMNKWIKKIKSLQTSNDNKLNCYDFIKISSNPSILKLIAKYGDKSGEHIQYGNKLKNKTGKNIILLTNLAFYVIKPTKDKIYKNCQKRISFKNISFIFIKSANSFQINSNGDIYNTDNEDLKIIIKILSNHHIKTKYNRNEDKNDFMDSDKNQISNNKKEKEKIYQKLINMSFHKENALKSADMFPNDLNNAIDYAIKHQNKYIHQNIQPISWSLSELLIFGYIRLFLCADINVNYDLMPDGIKMICRNYLINFNDMVNIRVICRFRPISESEKREEKIQSLQDDEPRISDNEQSVSIKRVRRNKKQKPLFKATLDGILSPNITQRYLYIKEGEPMVDELINGYNTAIIMYGQTGSGKTYTMFGNRKIRNESDFGLFQRCTAYLLNQLNNKSNIIKWKCDLSVVQIYKDRVTDLLVSADEPQIKLKVKTDFQTDVVFIENLKSVALNNSNDMLNQLKFISEARIVTTHLMGSTSNRHSLIFMLSVEQMMNNGKTRRNKMYFVVLGGSEDIRKALGADPDRMRLQEAISINKPYSAFTSTLCHLSKGHRPAYRISPLTHILQDCLGGNSKTSIICTASPHISNRSETIRTLRFAMTAVRVKNRPVSSDQ